MCRKRTQFGLLNGVRCSGDVYVARYCGSAMSAGYLFSADRDCWAREAGVMAWRVVSAFSDPLVEAAVSDMAENSRVFSLGTHRPGAWGSKLPPSKLGAVDPFSLVVVLIDAEVWKLFRHYSSWGAAFDEGVFGED